MGNNISPIGTIPIHLRHEIEKTEATYCLIAEARQHCQDQIQTQDLVDNLRLKELLELKSAFAGVTKNIIQKNTLSKMEEMGKDPTTSSDYSPRT